MNDTISFLIAIYLIVGVVIGMFGIIPLIDRDWTGKQYMMWTFLWPIAGLILAIKGLIQLIKEK